MKTLHFHNTPHAEFLLFPDNQPHVIVKGLEKGEEVKVICSISSSLRLLQLLQVSNALQHAGAVKKVLVIPYLMAARYDRIMQPGDSFDLEVVAGLINSCGFEQVILFDVHSPVALQLIANSSNVTNRIMVEQYRQDDAVLICPDAGAAKKVQEYQGWNDRIKEIVYCHKKRELSTGKLTLEVTEPGKCKDRNCVIIDDICDGGATFLAIAEQVEAKHLTLIVTHGIFSKGFTALERFFDEIIVSDSYGFLNEGHKVKQIRLDYAGF